MNRDKITAWIASHGFPVTDDGDAWHICIPTYNSHDNVHGWETCTAETYEDVRGELGY